VQGSVVKVELVSRKF